MFVPIHVEYVDTTKAPEPSLRAMHQLYVIWEAEDLPDDPHMPYEQRLVDWRHLHQFQSIPQWLLWDGTEAVATAGALMDRQQNLDNAYGWVFVRPDRRGARS